MKLIVTSISDGQTKVKEMACFGYANDPHFHSFDMVGGELSYPKAITTAFSKGADAYRITIDWDK